MVQIAAVIGRLKSNCGLNTEEWVFLVPWTGAQMVELDYLQA